MHAKLMTVLCLIGFSLQVYNDIYGKRKIDKVLIGVSKKKISFLCLRIFLCADVHYCSDMWQYIYSKAIREGSR